MTRAAVLFFKNVPGTFFNATHQVKQLRQQLLRTTLWVNRSIVPLLFTLHVFLPYFSHSNLKELTPYTHFYISLYSQFCEKQGITFRRPVFLVEIDHDDGTVKHILSHLNTTQERSNDRYLIYRHIGRRCIDQKPPYCFV